MRAAAATATAATAVTLGEVFVGRHAPELDRQADPTVDVASHLFELLLGGDEAARHVVLKERLAGKLEFTDLLSAKFHSGVLLVVQLFPALVHALALGARGIIVEKPLDLLTPFGDLRIADDGFTKFPGAGPQGGGFGNGGHARFIHPAR